MSWSLSHKLIVPATSWSRFFTGPKTLLRFVHPASSTSPPCNSFHLQLHHVLYMWATSWFYAPVEPSSIVFIKLLCLNVWTKVFHLPDSTCFQSFSNFHRPRQNLFILYFVNRLGLRLFHSSSTLQMHLIYFFSGADVIHFPCNTTFRIYFWVNFFLAGKLTWIEERKMSLKFKMTLVSFIIFTCFYHLY